LFDLRNRRCESSTETDVAYGSKGVIFYECRHFRFASDSRLIAVWDVW
jgi:hypothetical protein